MADIDTTIEVVLPDFSGIVGGLTDGVKKLVDDTKVAFQESTTESFTALTMFLMFSAGLIYFYRKVGVSRSGSSN